MDYDTAKRTAQELTGKLSDAHSPTVCPLCFSAFAHSLAYEHEQHVLNLRADCHEFFDNCVGILTTRRTPEELGRLKSALSIGQRRCSRHRLAGKGGFRFGVLLDSLSLILSTAFHSGKHAPIDRAMTTHKAFGDRLSRWPARPEQIYPAGEQDTVAALVELAELFICGAPLYELANCVLMARPAILPVIFSDPMRPRLGAVVCQTLMIRRSPANPWNSDPRSVVSAFLESIVRGPGAHVAGSDEFNQFISGFELKLYRTIERALSTAPSNMVGLKNLASRCQAAYFVLCPPGTPGPRLPPPEHSRRIISENARTRDIPRINYGTIMHILILEAGTSTRCASPACGLAQMQSDGSKKFQVCARCKIPRYCSKACQAHHWKHATPPHKAACPLLVKFNACAFLERKQGAFDEQYAKIVRDLEKAEIDTLNEWLKATRDEFGVLRELPLSMDIQIDIHADLALASSPA